MKVQARFKNEEPERWFEVELTDDQRMIDLETKREITDTNLLFRYDEDSEVVDMEQEWEDYRHEKIEEILHRSARYLARQVEKYNKGEFPRFFYYGDN